MSYSFANADGSFLSEQSDPPASVYTPLTATTVALPAGAASVLINPAGTIAALTVKLPPNPMLGQQVEIGFTQIVTALTVQDSAGSAVTGAPTAGAVGVSTELRWLNTAGVPKWVKWR